ncbi:MAG: hypothetical protein B6D76_09375 [gamma proteobacterium symbiont of Stewartia floridana]|nr:MAG: hypothetical protein B6D76_09375 [gamma proteobacterium symbiont of Stewartia floridana]RLW59583.1 MAG: hypothetical protein B6D75_08805 [gamma proteobacterium symbiont of Stewartia floridana]
MQGKKKQPAFAFISVKVSDYSVRSNAGINHQLIGSPRFVGDESEPVHQFETKLEITGICIEPVDRAGHRFQITIFGEPDVIDRMPRISDLHKKDDDGEHLYREYRGKGYPIYAQPPPVAYLEKIRGEDRWVASLWVTPQMVTDALIILSGQKQVYLSLHEIKSNRQRRIQNLSVQTVNPAYE